MKDIRHSFKLVLMYQLIYWALKLCPVESQSLIRWFAQIPIEK